MNRTEIMRQVSERTGNALPVVESVTDSLLETIADALLNGHTVNIRRFGKFELRVRSAVTRRNPRTQQPMTIPDRLSVTFLPSATLKERLNFPRR